MIKKLFSKFLIFSSKIYNNDLFNRNKNHKPIEKNTFKLNSGDIGHILIILQQITEKLPRPQKFQLFE